MLYIKLVWMYVIAMFTAIIIYPMMHEAGHFIAAVLVGADVVEISVLPIPYVSVFVNEKNLLGKVLIGMCGMIFPMLCIAFRPKRLFGTVIVSTIMLINAIAWMLSCLALIANQMGFCWENEDIITVSQCIGGVETGVFFFCLIAMTVNIHVLFKRKTIGRIMSFF